MGKHYASTLERRRDLPETRGRKKSPDPLIFKSVGLTSAQWDWLELWQRGASPSHLLRSLLDRAIKFWPSGPTKFR